VRITSNESGFTLTEVCVASAIVGPLLVAFMGASAVVGTAMSENERSADVTTTARGIGVQIAKLVMPCAPDTLKTKPVPLLRVLQSDVVAVPASTQFYGQTTTSTTGTTSTTTTTNLTETGPGGTTNGGAYTYSDVKIVMYEDGAISSEEEQMLADIQAGILSTDEAMATLRGTTLAGQVKGTTVADNGGQLSEVSHTGAAITTATSLLDLKDESHYVTPYDNYSEYRQKYMDWYYADKNGLLKDNWQPIRQFVPAQSLSFASVEGTQSMNAQARTLVRTIEFVRDPGEKLNAYDDDGDGMIDEGKLIMRYGKTTTILADKVEICTFTLEGRIVRFAIRVCRRDSKGRIHRTTIQKRILIRNIK
jgi:hypothetical protein